MSDFANQRALHLGDGWCIFGGSQDCLHVIGVFTLPLRRFNYEIRFAVRWKDGKKGSYGLGRVSYAQTVEGRVEQVSTAKGVVVARSFGGIPWMIL
jgi:hypothetical protein